MNQDRDIVLFRVDRKTGLLMLGALLVTLGGFALADQLTLTTSYPVPSGIYNQLITTGNAGAVAADTTFNRNGGNTILVPQATNVGGKVGIGTNAPASELDVVGGVRLGDDAAACTAAKAGTLRWHAGGLQVCDGTAWGSSVASGTWGGYCDRNTGRALYPATACTKIPNGSYHAWYITSCAAGWTPYIQTAQNPGSTTYTSSAECIKN